MRIQSATNVVFFELTRKLTGILYRFRRGRGIAIMLALVLTSLLGNAITFYYFDGQLKPEITPGDALWYSIISMTTIGYGDFFAESTGARIGTVFFVVFLGLSSFTGFLGVLVEWISDIIYRERHGMGTITSKNHILLINFPSEERIASILEEIVSDSHHREDIVIITDRYETLPPSLYRFPGLFFVRGSPFQEETYRRAGIDRATKALLLSPGYDDIQSDSIVASQAALVGHLNPGITIVAECLEKSHEILFQPTRCRSLIFPLNIANNLLVQESQDAGVSRLLYTLTSNRIGDTVYSTIVEENFDRNAMELARELLEANINLLAVERDNQTFTRFDRMPLYEGDRLIYVAEKRRDWASLKRVFS